MAYRLITAAALLLGSAAFPELTRDGTIKQHTDATARYDADKCFKKAGVASFISRNGTASFSSTSSVRSRACRTRPTPTAARATAICQADQT